MPVLPEVPSIIVPPGFKQTAALRLVNHPFADAVFHRAAGIHVIGFHVNFGLNAFGDAIQADQGRAAHGFENVVALHVRSFSSG